MDSRWRADPVNNQSGASFYSNGASLVPYSYGPNSGSWHGPAYIFPLPFRVPLDKDFKITMKCVMYGSTSGGYLMSGRVSFQSYGKNLWGVSINDGWPDGSTVYTYLQAIDNNGSFNTIMSDTSGSSAQRLIEIEGKAGMITVKHNGTVYQTSRIPQNCKYLTDVYYQLYQYTTYSVTSPSLDYLEITYWPEPDASPAHFMARTNFASMGR